MMNIFRRNQHEQQEQEQERDPTAPDVNYVSSAPTSPAATEHHHASFAPEDQDAASNHQPPSETGRQSPTGHQSPIDHQSTTDHQMNAATGYQSPTDHQGFQSPVYPGQDTPEEMKKSNYVDHPSTVDEDTVLATNDKTSVGRSGTWARGTGSSYSRQDSPEPGAGPARHQSLAERASVASAAISAEREAALSKAEKKDAKRLSKIIKSEGKAEDKQLKSALKELSSLQSAQKKAAANETAATHAQIKAAREEQRASAAYLEAKTRHEKAITNLKVMEERLALTRDQAQKTTGMVRHQAEEVDAMRERKATDDREREVKLAQLKQGLVAR